MFCRVRSTLEPVRLALRFPIAGRFFDDESKQALRNKRNVRQQRLDLRYAEMIIPGRGEMAVQEYVFVREEYTKQLAWAPVIRFWSCPML